MNYRIEKNKNFNSVEIYFEGIPAPEIRSNLKALKFRWHNVKKCWYGYAEEKQIIDILNGSEPKETKKDNNKKIDLSNLERIKLNCYGAEFAKVLRQELKQRNAKGVTIRSNRSGLTSSYTVTIELNPADFVSVEELAARRPDLYAHYLSNIWSGKEKSEKDFYKYSIESAKDKTVYSGRAVDMPQLTKQAQERCEAIRRICMAANYDNSDSMTDYYDVGYYLDIYFKCEPFEARETMTEEERAEVVADQKKEEEKRQKQLEEYERRKAEEKKAAEEYEKKHAEEVKTILNNIEVVELPKEKNYFITNLAQGIGKENSIEEVKENIKEYGGNVYDYLISSNVNIKTFEALEALNKNLLNDFNFIAGKGGTACNDSRVNEDNYMKLNQEQREKVKFYYCNCVAFYYNNELQFVADPQGYNYIRYAAIPTKQTEIKDPAEFETVAPKNEDKTPFYIPETVEAQAANLKSGEDITIYYSDGMCLNMLHTTAGQLERYEAKENNIVLYLSIKNKLYKLSLKSYNKMLIYNGIRTEIPRELVYKTDESRNGLRVEEENDTAETLKNIVNYYNDNPLIDTVQR